MLGVELVRDRESREPHPELAKFVMAHMRANCVLLSVDGPHASVLKMKPPVCVSTSDMDRMVDAMDNAINAYSAEERQRARRAPPAGASGAPAGQSHALPGLARILAQASDSATSRSSAAPAAPAPDADGSLASTATEHLASMLKRQR